MENWSHPDFAKLLSVLRDIGELGCEAIGLLPIPELRHSGYSVTPQNSLTFAGTGGDGVHFSFVKLPDTDPMLWPVLMTVPMNFDMPNLTVGADLRDFLGLGLRHGYFELEQLAYDFSATTAALDRAPNPLAYSSIKVRALAAIQRAFDIKPWQNHGHRLAALQAAFPIV